MLTVLAIVSCSAAVLLIGSFIILLRRRGLHRCFVTYVWQMPKRRLPAAGEEVHVILCFADHFEPKAGGANLEQGRQRVATWVAGYPKQFAPFADSDGRPPRWSFFFPAEEYEPQYLDALGELCREGFGEVEIHLHHDRDTAENLRATLLQFKETLAERHGLLARDRHGGDVKYGFIHGNWALCNAHGNGRFCGVNEELDILRETGCYADFTMPSAPHPAQTSTVNSIYYATNRPNRSRSHDTGIVAGAGVVPQESLLMVQGPLILDWRDRKRLILPRLENGCLQASQPPHIRRLQNWLRAAVQVPARPDWYFIKLHMHGAIEASHEVLLGKTMVQFHRDLAAYANGRAHFYFHYVTARELYNLVKAAESGWQGGVNEARDFKLLWNGSVPAEMGALQK